MIYNDELYHFGKKGMKWGHHNSKVKTKKEPKKKLHIDTKTRVKGKNMTEEIMGGIGIGAASSLIGGALMNNGHIQLGGILASVGPLYAAGSVIGSVYGRSYRE